MALNINIHTPNGLVPISPELTYTLIVDVLGYTPLDASNYVAYDSISDVDNSAFYVVDSQLHILAQIDEDGLKAAIMTVNGKDVESGLIYDIKELADDAFYIVDSQSNVIAKIGENGLETTNVIALSIITNSIESPDSELYIVDTNNRPILSVDANGLETTNVIAQSMITDNIESSNSELYIVDTNNRPILSVDANGLETTNIVATDAVLSLHSVVDHIEDYEIHITEEERQSWNSKSKFDSISEDDNTTLYINDKDGKTIAKFDANGLTVTNVSTNDVTVGGDKSVLSHINNTSIHITDAERSTWNTVTSKASKSDLNAHINDTDKHLGDEISLADNSALYINDKDNNTIVKVNSEGLIAAEVILQADKELYSLLEHVTNTDIHVQEGERESWNAKIDSSTLTQKLAEKTDKTDFNSHIQDTDLHLGDEISLDDNTTLYINDKDGKTIVRVDNNGLTAANISTNIVVVNGESVVELIDNKVDTSVFSAHITDTNVHLRDGERTIWNTVVNKVDTSVFNKEQGVQNTSIATLFTYKVDTSVYNAGQNVQNASIDKLFTYKVDTSVFNTHITDTSVHLRDGERTKWNTVVNKVDTSVYNAGQDAQNDLINKLFTDKLDTSVYNEDKLILNKTISDISTKVGTKANQTDFEEHINDTDLHLGGEISLEDNSTLYITDKDGKIIVRADEDGLAASNLFIDDKEVATKEYVNGKVTGLFEFKGSISSSTEVPAVHEVGDAYRINKAGEYADNICEKGDMLVCIADGSTANNADWTVLQLNWTAVDGNADLSWGKSITLATIGGVNINAKLPDNPDTTYSPGTGLKLDDTTFNHKNSITAGTVSGGSGLLDYNGTIKIPSITYDSEGHITSTSTTSYTLPDNSNVTSKIATGNNGSTSNTTTEVSNPYINHVEGSIVNSSVQFTGANTATVKAVNGVITIDSGVTSADTSKWNKVVNKVDTSVYNAEQDVQNASIASKLDISVYNADKTALNKTISDISTKVSTKANQTDFEEHITNTDLHLGDEINLEDDSTLYITDKDSAIIAKFSQSGFDAKLIRQDDNVVASNVIVDASTDTPYIAEDGTLHLTSTVNGLTIKGTIEPSNLIYTFPISSKINDAYVVSRDALSGELPKNAKKGDLWVCVKASEWVCDGEKCILEHPVFNFDGVNLCGPAGKDGTSIAVEDSSYLDVSSKIVNNTNTLFVNVKTQTLEDAISTGVDGGLATAHNVATIIHNNELVVTSALNAFKNKIGLANDLTIDWEGKYEAGTSIIEAIKNINDTSISYVTNRYSLKFGNKSYDGSSEQTITAEDLGLSQTDKISTKGYKYNDTTGSFEHYNVAHDGDASTVGDNKALGKNSVVFGQDNEISAGGEGSAIIGGQGNVISGAVSVILGGYGNNVSGSYSFAEGQGNTVTANTGHAEGTNNTASGKGAHAEGANNTASGDYSHAEGWGAAAQNNLALGDGSHVEGVLTTAQNKGEHAEGCSNVSHKATDTYGDAGNTISSIGCGKNDGVNKQNAVEVMQNGDVYVKGIGGYNGTDIKTQNIDILTLAEVIDALQPMKSLTYAELVTLVSEGKLVAGKKYRITDYVATTTEEGSMSANHPFDIVVTALDNHNLGTQASALPHEGDTYFANVSMKEWQIWYSIDNDTNRWSWADSTNGKGVIYRMIDEFGNDVGYDFKGIVFKRHKITGFNADGAELANSELTKVIGKYTHESTTNAYFAIDEADYKWFYLFSVLKNDVITDYSVDFMEDDWQGNKQRPLYNEYTNGQYLLNGVHIVYNSGRPAERTRARFNSRFWTCEANCTGWDCDIASQSWYATVASQSWKAFACVGFISDISNWQAKYGSYNVYTGDFNGLDAGNNGMCWFIGNTSNAKRYCKLVDGTNPYSWNTQIVKIDFPEQNYWCGKNSNGEIVYWLPADLAPTTTPTE